MCNISGAMFALGHGSWAQQHVEGMLGQVFRKGLERGRDGFGLVVGGDSAGPPGTSHRLYESRKFGHVDAGWMQVVQKDASEHMRTHGWVLANHRAEPTTEWVEHKTEEDQQPYVRGKPGMRWIVVHNGTIANDKELRVQHNLGPGETNVDSAVIADLLAKKLQPDDVFTPSTPAAVALFLHEHLIGSYALAIGNEAWGDDLLLMCNYKPISIAVNQTLGAMVFTSMADGFDLGLAARLEGDWNVQQMEPYSAMVVRRSQDLTRAAMGTSRRLIFHSFSLKTYSRGHQMRGGKPRKTLVVCSGGLDSTVAAAVAKERGDDVTLLHFTYGCRAEEAEKLAVRWIGDKLGVGWRFEDLTTIFHRIGNSRLTGTLASEGGGFAQGEAGAEFAHEWVPSRNLIMLSVAAGIAEGQGFDSIVLGNNLEESGAYPDNEPDFIRRFGETLLLAVKAGRHIDVEQPVGNLMKKEIVQLGLRLGAPLGLTWSCYENGSQHCGRCGPCYMRRKAFWMLGEIDPVLYISDAEWDQPPAGFPTEYPAEYVD